MTNDELIDRAAAVFNPQELGDRSSGTVGAALITEGGNVFVGVCIDTPSSMGFCAEYAAIATMVTAGEFRIERIVAIWKDKGGAVVILPPCGRCREFIKQIDPANIDTQVILARDNVLPLRDLLPYHEWPS